MGIGESGCPSAIFENDGLEKDFGGERVRNVARIME